MTVHPSTQRYRLTTTSSLNPCALVLPAASGCACSHSSPGPYTAPCHSRCQYTCAYLPTCLAPWPVGTALAQQHLSLIHISEPTRQAEISYAVFCLKKKKT